MKMGTSLKLKYLALGAACLGLTACGNDLDSRIKTDAVKDVFAIIKAKAQGNVEVPTPPNAGDVINRTLAAVPNAPLQFVLFEETEAFGIAAIYGVNQGHVTWVLPERTTLTLRKGTLVATRGFGSDLMSLEDGGAANLISQRRSGRVEKTYRFLDRQDLTNRLTMICDITRGGTERVVAGQVSVPAQVMIEHCESSTGFEIENRYWIDGAGRMVQSLQWVSAQVGRVIFQRLRY